MEPCYASEPAGKASGTLPWSLNPVYAGGNTFLLTPWPKPH